MKIKIALFIVTAAVIFSINARADGIDEGRELLSNGDLKAAAEFFNRYALANPKDSKNTPEALALCGRALDAMADVLTGAAEHACYWAKGGSRTPACMEKEVGSFNAKYGNGAFRFDNAIAYIYYTGSHYRQILDRFPKGPYAPEADFYLLLHGLIGHPDAILSKVKEFLSKYPKGEWNRKGLLMWARVNEDIWYVHRKWSWVLFNDKIAPDELTVRAEKYRQEALRTYEKLMKDKGTFEGNTAAKEYAVLKDSQDDMATYSIVEDSIPGTLSKWGIELEPR